MTRDFLSIGEDAERAVAPDVSAALAHQAGQQIYQLKGGNVLFPPPISATGIPERIRDVMWWKPTVLRRGESYSAFKKRADAQRAARHGGAE